MPRKAILPVALILLGLAGLIWCAWDAAASRSALMSAVKVNSTAQIDWQPENAPDWYVVDSSEALASYESVAQGLIAPGEDTTEGRAFRLFHHVSQLGGHDVYEQDVRSVPSDDVRVMMEQANSHEFQGNCSDYSYILQTLAQTAGLHSRVVGMHADVWMDGWGHALNEIYIPERAKWVALDPLRHAYFTDARGEPLSLREVRERILNNREADLKVIQGTIQAKPDSAEQVVRYYRNHIDRISYQGSLDLIEGRDRIYDSWLANVIQMETLPRPVRRALENGLWSKDRHYLFVDRPEVNDTLSGYFVFRGSLALIFLCSIWLIGLGIVSRRD